MHRIAALPCLCALALAGACGHASPATPPAARAAESAPPGMLDALFEGGRVTLALDELAGRAPLAAGETFKIVEVGRDANSSHHIVALREREPLHRHDHHDLLVVILQGAGQMLIGASEQPISARSIVYVPRGTVHSMRPTSPEPITAYAVFVPPFDGKDRVLVDSAAAPPSP